MTTLGSLDLLALPKAALFCSARCPGSVIRPAYDQAAKWRDAGRCVIGGFHSPVEKECLQILLRGDAPVILCPARGMLERLPAQWSIAIADGRMLLLSFFPTAASHITAELATRRNEYVAALATEILVIHASPGGKLEKQVVGWELAWKLVARLASSEAGAAIGTCSTPSKRSNTWIRVM